MPLQIAILPAAGRRRVPVVGRRNYSCCESEEQMGYDDGDQYANECWLCQHNSLPGCP